jgi:Tfp pilus assembly protein FimV
MRRFRQPAQIASSVLRLAIRQAFARPLLTGSLLLALAPAGQSLTLGDISVRSTLGQRLDATVPVRLSAGEALASGCVAPGRQTSDLRSVPLPIVTTPQAAREGLYELRVTSTASLYEPMYELELKVECPGAPIIIRQYVLMLDLPAAVASSKGPASESALVPSSATSIPPPGTLQVADAGAESLTVTPAAARRRATTSRAGATIEPGARYRVADGDSLSSIAARVRNRTASLWTVAHAIQAANPEAFIRNDENLIKLGSEIVIPAATPTSASTESAGPTAPQPSVPISVPIPTPVAPPVLATELKGPAEPAPPALSTTELAKASRPAVSTAPVSRRTALPKPSAAPITAVDEPNPVIAAGAGILFGLCISALLWARGRLPSRKRLATAPAPAREAPSPFPRASLAAATAPAPAPLAVRSIEPAFSVSYTPPAEDTIGMDVTDEHVTSQLEELFDSPETTIQKRLNAGKTTASPSPGNALQNDEAQVLATPGNKVDLLLGDPAEADPTSQSGTMDIHALAASATKDPQQEQTLLEALTLLERDYEEELTASQVLDMSAVREALGSDFDDPTEICDKQIREASVRKQAR